MNTNTSTSSTTQPKRFASVRDLVKATAADDGRIRDFDRRIKGATIVNALIRSRAAAGMTQADVAVRMKRTQSAVSKLEHSADAELNQQDIASYLTATHGRLNLIIGKQANRVERIKELATCLKDELESLAGPSSNSDDRAIRQSINGFFGEVWFNLFKILCDATSRLPKEAEETSSLKLVGTEPASASVKPRTGMASC